jgi:hypothetical protein
VHRQAELPHAVQAAGAPGAFLGTGQRRDQDRRQDGDDGHDDHQFDQREGAGWAGVEARSG